MKYKNRTISTMRFIPWAFNLYETAFMILNLDLAICCLYSDIRFESIVIELVIRLYDGSDLKTYLLMR